MLAFAQEPLTSALFDDILRLAKLHWQENETWRDYQGFNPDRKRYIHYSEIGIYFQFTARDEGRLVGYGGLYIVPSMHTQKLIATEDTYYLHPDYRKGRNAFRFFEFMERFLISKGVVECSLTTPVCNSRAERVVAFMGYEQVAKGWSKRLEEAVHVQSVSATSA